MSQPSPLLRSKRQNLVPDTSTEEMEAAAIECAVLKQQAEIAQMRLQAAHCARLDRVLGALTEGVCDLSRRARQTEDDQDAAGLWETMDTLAFRFRQIVTGQGE